jgi:hypothetical protein
MAKALFCDDQCREAFAEDRRYGLIYGPYRFEDGTLALTWERASERDEFCAYCGPTKDLSKET